MNQRLASIKQTGTCYQATVYERVNGRLLRVRPVMLVCGPLPVVTKWEEAFSDGVRVPPGRWSRVYGRAVAAVRACFPSREVE